MKRRVALFAALLVVCGIVGGVYLVSARDRVEEAARRAPILAVAPRGSLKEFLAEPHVAFRSTDGDATTGKVAVVPASDPGGPRAVTDLECDRVDAVATGGICLITHPGVIASYEGIVFDQNLEDRYSVELQGIPSRARVSSDGKYASATVFVTGDSYAPGTFSTRASIIEMKTGKLLGTLEDFKVTHNGKRVDAIDQNYWGVTFAPDSDTFYATLSTGGNLYMVKGSVKAKTAKVVAENVECPSVSPDGTRIAYKKNRAGGLDAPDWQIHVLDLQTKKDLATSETRNVDDQVEWIDDQTIAYALPRPGSEGEKNVWKVRADGAGKPKLLMELASSPSVSGASQSTSDPR